MKESRIKEKEIKEKEIKEKEIKEKEIKEGRMDEGRMEEKEIKEGRMNEGYSLYPHQENIVGYMEKRERLGDLGGDSNIRGGLICASMGLGKTFTSLYYAFSTREKGKTLVVASKTLIGEWINEYHKFFSGYKILVLHRDFIGTEIDRIDRERIEQFDIVFTTYEMVVKSASNGSVKSIGERFGVEVRDPITSVVEYRNRTDPPTCDNHVIGISLIHQYPWHRIIADEIQCISNPKTSRFISMLALFSENRWGLTGTPLRNSDQDMWSIFKFLGYEEIRNPKKWSYESYLKSPQLQSLIFRIDYKDTNITIPKKEVHTYHLSMTQTQEEIYRYYFLELWSEYNRFIQGDQNDFALILALFTRLRQICNAPYLITDESKRSSTGSTGSTGSKSDVIVPTLLTYSESSEIKSLEDWVHTEKDAGEEMPKIKKIKEITEEVLKKNEKILIYSSFVACLDLISKSLRKIDSSILKDTQILTLDGSITGDRRQKYLDLYKTNEKYRILLSNYKVGAEGLNLTEANHVICVEPWWTPIIENQAISRAWRIGQKKTVHVHRIIIDGTIETQIVKMGDAKESIIKSYFSLDPKGRIPIPKLDKQTLWEILQNGKEHLFRRNIKTQNIKNKI